MDYTYTIADVIYEYEYNGSTILTGAAKSIALAEREPERPSSGQECPAVQHRDRTQPRRERHYRRDCGK